jgi:hypothetical protein
MGQYWQPMNVDKYQTLGGWGKLGEFFWQSAGPLLFAIARPIVTFKALLPLAGSHTESDEKVQVISRHSD